MPESAKKDHNNNLSICKVIASDCNHLFTLFIEKTKSVKEWNRIYLTVVASATAEVFPNAIVA